MTSKNSFLARVMENGKRRLWLLVVSLLAFVVAIPTFTAMNLSVISNRQYLIEEMKVKEALYEFASGMYSASNGFVFFLIAFFASMCGIQGFSYLYDRSKVDFYHSKPVKATTRFFSIWTNGILVFIVPYLIGTLLNLVFFAANGILDVKLFNSVWIYVLLALFFYLCIYHVAILALMLTGKLGVTCLGIVVFLAYEVCIRSLIWVCYETFYRFFYSASEALTTWIRPILSPITYLMYYVSEEWNLGITLLALLLFAAAVLALALWCYKKRPTELAGSAMTFSVTKPVIKIGIAVPASLFVGIWTSYMVDYSPAYGTGNPGFPLFIGTLAVLIICGLIQVIYEADIKGIFHKKAEIVISFAIAMVIALFFRFDLSGYDTRVPDMEDIEYATILTETGDYWLRVYLDEGMVWRSKEEYVNRHMRLTGETAEAVRNLASESIKMYMDYPTRDAYYNAYTQIYYVVFDFCLKNGTHITREIPIALSEDNIATYVEQIETAEEYIRANEPAMSEYLLAEVMSGEWKVEASWGNELFEEKMTSAQAVGLLKAYRQDLLQNNYQARSSSLPIGVFGLYLDTTDLAESSGYYYGRELQCKIYPDFSNSIAYLKQNGFVTDALISTENIEKITVSRDYPTEDGETVYYDAGYYEKAVAVAEMESFTETVTYSEQNDMTEILKNSHSEMLGYENWYTEYPYEEVYRVRVYLKPDSLYYDEYNEYVHYYFLKDQVPDFVKTDFPDDKIATE